MQTRKILLSLGLILSVLAVASPSFARGGGGGHSSGGGGHWSGGMSGAHSAGSNPTPPAPAANAAAGGGTHGWYPGFFHGGRGYGYGYGGGYGNGYGYGNTGAVWGQGAAWGSGYSAGNGGGGSATGYAGSYSPEQLVKNYSWPDSHSPTNAAYAPTQATNPAPQMASMPTGKAAKAGVLDDLIKETSKY